MTNEDNVSVYSKQSQNTITPSQISVLYKELQTIQTRFDLLERLLEEQELRKHNPPTVDEKVKNAFPSFKSVLIAWCPFTGMFGLHQYLYTEDLSLTIMYCIFPGVFWLFDLVLFFFSKSKMVQKFRRMFYTFVFFFFGITIYASIMPLKQNLPSPEITLFFGLYAVNTIGIQTLFYSSLIFKCFPKSPYFSMVLFFYMYYYERVTKTTKLNDYGLLGRRIIYTTSVVLSIGYYKNALLDKDTHLATQEYLIELSNIFTFGINQAKYEIQNNAYELKHDLFT